MLQLAETSESELSSMSESLPSESLLVCSGSLIELFLVRLIDDALILYDCTYLLLFFLS
jgi:hypothetical protein